MKLLGNFKTSEQVSWNDQVLSIFEHLLCMCDCGLHISLGNKAMLNHKRFESNPKKIGSPIRFWKQKRPELQKIGMIVSQGRGIIPPTVDRFVVFQNKHQRPLWGTCQHQWGTMGWHLGVWCLAFGSLYCELPGWRVGWDTGGQGWSWGVPRVWGCPLHYFPYVSTPWNGGGIDGFLNAHPAHGVVVYGVFLLKFAFLRQIPGLLWEILHLDQL